MTAPNTELAYRVLDQIDAHPENWNQNEWQCGTAACFAGWAIRLSGGTMSGSQYDVWVADGLPELRGEQASRAAESLLGLPVGEYDNCDDEHLFDPDNTREDLGRLVAEIFGPRPEPVPAAEPIGLVEGDTAAEQYDNAYARYEADECDVPPNAGSAGC